VWVSIYVQTDARVSNTGRKTTTPITNPFELTIEADHSREKELYTSTLVGFIYHDNQDESIDHGHYTAHVKNKAGRWVEYSDESVSELKEKPLEKAQKAYLYFYQAK
jgi:ubiquitin C-terminal hydrolase